jgi:hypothetical protein
MQYIEGKTANPAAAHGERRAPLDPLLKKLQYKGQSPVLVVDAPAEMAKLLKGLEGEVHQKPKAEYEFLLLFTMRAAHLEASLRAVAPHVKGDAMFWVCYPKGTSKKYSAEVNRDSIVKMASAAGLAGVTMVALDGDWSALRVRGARYVGSHAGKT